MDTLTDIELLTGNTYRGFSGALVEVTIQDGRQVAIKTGDIARNLSQLQLLSSTSIPVPRVLNSTPTSITMEYIRGIAVHKAISNGKLDDIFDNIAAYLAFFATTSTTYDYTTVYKKFLDEEIDYTNLPFTSRQLLTHLPRFLPRSTYYHGDFTLENMIFAHDRTVLIDPVVTPFDSWVFDIAKLRQDLDGGWFVRCHDEHHHAARGEIKQRLQQHWPAAFDDSLYILMLLRVYRHCHHDTREYQLILDEINRTWSHLWK